MPYGVVVFAAQNMRVVVTRPQAMHASSRLRCDAGSRRRSVSLKRRPILKAPVHGFQIHFGAGDPEVSASALGDKGQFRRLQTRRSPSISLVTQSTPAVPKIPVEIRLRFSTCQRQSR